MWRIKVYILWVLDELLERGYLYIHDKYLKNYWKHHIGDLIAAQKERWHK